MAKKTAQNGANLPVDDDPSDELSQSQLTVIAELLAGKSQRDAAKTAGVSEFTVSRWKSKDALFVAELNRQRGELYRQHVDDLQSIAGEARGILREVVTSPFISWDIQLKAALAIVKMITPPAGPETVDDVRVQWQQAERDRWDRDRESKITDIERVLALE